jgi:hypothetical protein
LIGTDSIIVLELREGAEIFRVDDAGLSEDWTCIQSAMSKKRLLIEVEKLEMMTTFHRVYKCVLLAQGSKNCPWARPGQPGQHPYQNIKLFPRFIIQLAGKVLVMLSLGAVVVSDF